MSFPIEALVLGVLPNVKPAVAAARVPSSVPDVVGRNSAPESLCGNNAGENAVSAKDEDAADR